MSKIQPLEKRIASYGDASDISCMERRNSIWRPSERGAAERDVNLVVSLTPLTWS